MFGAPSGGLTLNGFGLGTFRQSGSVIGGCFGGRIGSTSPSLYAVGCAGAGVGQASAACIALFGVTVVKALAASKCRCSPIRRADECPLWIGPFPNSWSWWFLSRVALKPSAGATHQHAN